MIYTQPRTETQSLYYRLWSRAGPGGRLLPLDGRRYLTDYVLLREFHRRLHPFQFVTPGSCVIQVGCASVLVAWGVPNPSSCRR